MLVTFIAGQHFAKNVANIEFEFDVVSSWHSDMAKSFTSLPDSPVVLYSHHTKFGNATKSSVLQRWHHVQWNQATGVYVEVRGFGSTVWSALSTVYNDLARRFRGRLKHAKMREIYANTNWYCCNHSFKIIRLIIYSLMELIVLVWVRTARFQTPISLKLR